MMDDMYDNAADFGRALSRLVARCNVEAATVCRKAAVDLWGKVMEDNPKDTVRCAAGWILTPDRPSESVPPEGLDHYTLPTAQDPGPSANFEWWLVNNVEYVSYLEDGHSDSKPTGFVANAMQSFADHFNRYLADMDTISA